MHKEHWLLTKVVTNKSDMSISFIPSDAARAPEIRVSVASPHCFQATWNDQRATRHTEPIDLSWCYLLILRNLVSGAVARKALDS